MWVTNVPKYLIKTIRNTNRKINKLMPSPLIYTHVYRWCPDDFDIKDTNTSKSPHLYFFLQIDIVERLVNYYADFTISYLFLTNAGSSLLFRVFFLHGSFFICI